MGPRIHRSAEVLGLVSQPTPMHVSLNEHMWFALAQ